MAASTSTDQTTPFHLSKQINHHARSICSTSIER